MAPGDLDFERLFRDAPALLLVLQADAQFTILDATDAYLRATFTERTKIVNHGLFDVFPDNPDDHSATGARNLRASLQRVMTSRAPDTMAVQKYDVRRPDSTGGGFEERFWSPVNSPVLASDGRIRYIIHRVEDVTDYVRGSLPEAVQHEPSDAVERRNRALEREILQRSRELDALNRSLQQINEALNTEIAERKRAQNWLSELLRSAPDGIIIVDREGRIVLANDQAGLHFGYTTEELTGQSIEILVPDRQRRSHTEHRARYIATPRRRNMGEGLELLGQRKDGSFFPVEISLSPIETAEGLWVAGIIRDITQRKQETEQIRRLNEDLRRHTVELEAANRELEAFSYSVSHDLRAPLRSIDGFSQALLEDYAAQLDQTARDHLARVRAATQRMGVLIDDLLALSRVTRSELHPEAIDVSALAESIADELRHTYPARRVEVDIEPGLQAMGDGRLLRIALTNLLSNAWKFTEPRPIARIRIGRYVAEDGRSGFFVRDNGVGFNMAYAHKLFGAFQRLHAANEFPGTGIGLATVQRIVQRHGGRIWTEAAVDAGASFFFTLRSEVPS